MCLNVKHKSVSILLLLIIMFVDYKFSSKKISYCFVSCFTVTMLLNIIFLIKTISWHIKSWQIFRFNLSNKIAQF